MQRSALLVTKQTQSYMFNPNLHISIGWASESIPYDRLNWKNMGDPNILTLLDPLPIIDTRCVILRSGFKTFNRV
jgi:hypothetical protein